MTTINLKDFYYWYTQDQFIEVSDEVAEVFVSDARHEMAYQRRLSRHKAQYSLDCDDGIEYSACLHEPTPQELLERMELFIRLWNALHAHDRFAVGDQILVRVTEVNKTSQEELSVHADVKSVTENTSHEALKRCRVQSKYAGRVTDVHKGIVYVRLSNGVNAVAHSCYDRRTPGKKDDVSFVVTKLDEERSIAVGIITRIIRQNL